MRAQTDLLSLPIDQYQRYKLAQEIVEKLKYAWRLNRLEVLEVGGSQGLIRGFLPHDTTYILDLAEGSFPKYVRGDGRRLPFGDKAFDISISIDTLEHIRPEARASFLSELCRVGKRGVLLGAPFHSEEAVECEAILFEFLEKVLGYQHEYLTEHRAYELPVLSQVLEHLSTIGAKNQRVVPNGFLPRWLVMMIVQYYLMSQQDLDRLLRLTCRYYNKNYYRSDNRSPSYRHFIVALRENSGEVLDFSDLVDPAPDPHLDWIYPAILLHLRSIDLLREQERKIEDLQALVRAFEQGRFIRTMAALHRLIHRFRSPNGA